MLSRALEGGAQKGRIRKGGKGNLAFFMVGKDKRKVIFDKWKRDKTSVGYKDVKSVKQGSQEFFKIQVRQCIAILAQYNDSFNELILILGPTKETWWDNARGE